MTTAYNHCSVNQEKHPMVTTCNYSHVNEKYPMTTAYMITVLLMKRSIPMATTYIYCHVNEKYPYMTTAYNHCSVNEEKHPHGNNL